MTCIDLIIYIVSVTFLFNVIAYILCRRCLLYNALCFSFLQSNNNARHAPSATSSASTRTTQATLPSRFQSFLSTSTSVGSISKRRTSGSVGRTKTWSKDVVCILKEEEDFAPESTCFSIPRGQVRAKLAEKVLVGKIRIVSTSSPQQVSYPCSCLPY